MAENKRNQLKKFKKAVLDILFPAYCLVCEKEGLWLCNQCAKKVKILDQLACPQCEKEITVGGKLCQRCRCEKKLPLNALISSVNYDAPAIKKLIYGFKYRYLADAAGILSFFMVKALLFHDCPLPSIIVPVPLHPRRLRWRGFNQARLLAENISQNLAPPLKIPVLDILERKKYNKPQMELRNYQDRLGNVRNLFQIKSGANLNPVKNKTILLIDDIATTGATLEECAKVLKDTGARKIVAAVVTRQTIRK